MMLPQEIIRKKRDGERLGSDAIAALVADLASGALSEGQAAAFAMAVYFRGMEPAECAALTRAMAQSGSMLDWRGADLAGPVVDKHSTGGVGDVVSLILAPLIAACGAYVPMISGRGLGHTGGTLDKLNAIPGYTTQPGKDRFIDVVRQCGCAIIGQTADLAPADKRLYAIRDVTATVESVPLITASILSKKLAAGLEHLVMDVKVGSGAFLPDIADARRLARSIVDVAQAAGLPTRALLTDMNEPLASAAGNALEVAVAVAHLTGHKREPRLDAVVRALGAEMLVATGLAATEAAAFERLERAFDSGAAAERFAKMVRALGGPGDLLENPQTHLPAAPVVRAVTVPAAIVRRIDTRALGLAVVALGGGRRRPSDAIDARVGLSEMAGVADAVSQTRPLCFVHAADEDTAEAAVRTVIEAYEMGDTMPASVKPCIIEQILPA